MVKLFIFDFDSTLVSFETLDALAEGSVGKPTEIARITEAAMSGELDFGEALRQRVALLDVKKNDVLALGDLAWMQICPSIKRNREFFKQNETYIVSGGFVEVITPVAIELGIPVDNIFANRFIYDDENRVIGVQEGPLAHENGKSVVVSALKRPDATIVMIGDGWSDYQVRQSGAADTFYAFTEVVHREKVCAGCDCVAPTFEHILEREGIAL